MNRVFIGWDSRFPEPALVAAYSLRKHSSIPLDVRFLDLRHLRECYGFNPRPDPKASTEFTTSRFLVPWLCDYAGRALFVDNDVLFLADVDLLFRKAESDLRHVRDAKMLVPSVWCVQHDHQPVTGTKMYGAAQTAYPRKNWSSVMMLNCDQLHCWSKEVVEAADGARLHRFADLHDAEIENLPARWNHLTDMTDQTAILHYTEGGPWFPAYENCPHADLWRQYRDEMRKETGRAVLEG